MKKIISLFIAMAVFATMILTFPMAAVAESDFPISELTSAGEQLTNTTQPNSERISIKQPIVDTERSTRSQNFGAKDPRDEAAGGDGYEEIINNDDGSKYTVQYDDDDNVVAKTLTLPADAKLYVGSAGEIYFYNGEERTKIENGITAFEVEDIVGDNVTDADGNLLNPPTIYAKDGLLYGYIYRGYEYSDDFYGYYNTFNSDYEGFENVLIACPRGMSGEVTIADGTSLIDSYAFATCTFVTNVIVPDSVKSVAMGAFQNCVSLTDVSLGEGVTGLEDSAFWNCKSLKNITVPDSVGFIGDYAFYECNSLKTAEIGGGVTYIGGGVFYACYLLTDINVSEENQTYASVGGVLFNEDLTELIKCPTAKAGEYDIPEGVVTITNNAFEDCVAITAVTIPDGVTDINDNAFNYCKSLKSIVIPDSVTRIGEYGFVACNSLVSAEIGSGVTEIGRGAFFMCSSLKSIDIPDSVLKIDIGTFDSCTSLETVILGTGITEIGQGAFEQCPSLTEITIPASVATFGSWPFYGCTSLSAINVDETSPYFASIDGVLFDKDITKLIVCPTGFEGEFEIPNGTLEITSYAFQECAMLTAVTIPDSVTTIGEEAFAKCTSLTSIDIPDSTAEIGWGAFRECTALSEITIGSGYVDYIHGLFLSCTSIGEINVSEDNPEYASIDGVLFNKDITEIMLCPNSRKGSYTIPASVTGIYSGAFYACKYLTEINVHEDNTEYASVDGVLFSKDLTELLAFPEGKGGEYTVPGSVTWVDDYAFANCSLLTEILVDESNTKYTSIDGVLFNKDVTAIVSYPAGKSGSYVLPSSVTDIGGNDKPVVSIPGTGMGGVAGSQVGDGAFMGCTLLTAITLPENAKDIGDYAFHGCSSLTEIVIPNSVRVIGRYAFYGCTSLKSVTLPDNDYTAIEIAAFKNCSALTELIAPENVYVKWGGIFEGCNNLVIYGYPAAVGADSRAPENYAKNNDIPFVNLEKERLVYGDIDDDKVLGITDLVIVAKTIHSRDSVTANLILAADLNNDGVVNAIDLAIVKYFLLSIR